MQGVKITHKKRYNVPAPEPGRRVTTKKKRCEVGRLSYKFEVEFEVLLASSEYVLDDESCC